MNAEPMASRHANRVDLFFFRWKLFHYFFAYEICMFDEWMSCLRSCLTS